MDGWTCVKNKHGQLSILTLVVYILKTFESTLCVLSLPKNKM